MVSHRALRRVLSAAALACLALPGVAAAQAGPLALSVSDVAGAHRLDPFDRERGDVRVVVSRAGGVVLDVRGGADFDLAPGDVVGVGEPARTFTYDGGAQFDGLCAGAPSFAVRHSTGTLSFVGLSDPAGVSGDRRRLTYEPGRGPGTTPVAVDRGLPANGRVFAGIEQAFGDLSLFVGTDGLVTGCAAPPAPAAVPAPVPGPPNGLPAPVIRPLPVAPRPTARRRVARLAPGADVADLARGRLRLLVAAPGAGRLTQRMFRVAANGRRGSLIGRGARNVRRAGSVRVTVKPTRAGRRAARSRRALRVRVVTSFDPRGSRRARTLGTDTFTLPR